MTGTDDARRPLRIDAERNRVRIVEAAQTAFAERGLDVPLEDVADQAGVGIATLYRRFPTRDDLIAACFARRLDEHAQAAEDALEARDGWSGFAGYVEQICSMQAADNGLKDVLTHTFPSAKVLEAHRARGYELSLRLIERAQAEGSLRSDVVPEDLILLLMANAGVVQGAGRAAPDAWRRFVGLMLDGFRSERANPLAPPPSPRQLMRAMLRLARTPGATGSRPRPQASRWLSHVEALGKPTACSIPRRQIATSTWTSEVDSPRLKPHIEWSGPLLAQHVRTEMTCIGEARSAR
jgi:AcrR family transcriptional regulator